MKNMPNAKKIRAQVNGKSVVLFLMSKADYSNKIIELAGIVASENKSTCYVSVNKPASVLIKALGEANIDTKKFWFIDCISHSAFGEGNETKKGQKDSLILYVSSPRNLTELSIDISGAVGNGMKSIFVDALSTFLIYEDGLVVIRFAHNVIAKLREYDCRGYFVVLKNDISSALLDDLSMFVDEVVEV